jgi:hypothetical protein
MAAARRRNGVKLPLTASDPVPEDQFFIDRALRRPIPLLLI